MVSRAAAELGTYSPDQPIVEAELSAVATIELIALVQLAARMPALPERQKKFAREIVGNFARAYNPEHTGIAELIKRGWQKEHDVKLPTPTIQP